MHKFPEFPVLIADDEPSVCLSVSSVLKAAGINNIIECNDARKIFTEIETSKPGIILLDLMMPGRSGEEILLEIKHSYPDTNVIIVTGKDDLPTAVECMKNGAFDYIPKPVDENALIPSVKRAVNLQELLLENMKLTSSLLESHIGKNSAFREIITNNHKMKKLFSYTEAIAASSQPVLITGETGTGKELFAKAIHRLSGRKGKFTPVNVSGLDSNVFSDTLFGHVKGAFTGAEGHRNGMVEEARDGTLFLDEIGDLDEINQVKLLRLLQEREYTPLGADAPKLTNTKIIVATLQDLQELVNKNKFRKDLYYRLCAHHIKIPPLRDRIDDLPCLLDFFMEEAASELGKKKPSYPPELILHLKNYDFPGNIRELRAMTFNAVTSHQSRVLSTASFKTNIKSTKKSPVLAPTHTENSNIYSGISSLPTLKNSAEMLVNEAMRRTENNQSAAAGILGISQQALSKRISNMKQSKRPTN